LLFQDFLAGKLDCFEPVAIYAANRNIE
jgi:hypothetical protein